MEQPHGLVETSPVESTGESVTARRCAAVSTATAEMIKCVRAVRTFWQRYLDVFLGGVLVLAGALKAQQLWADPTAGRASGFPRELLIGAAAFELAFGCWLLAGLYRRITRWLALAWFTTLAAVALAQAVGGVPSCACLGEIHASPWIMFSFDVAAVGALWEWSPKDYASRQGFPTTLCLSLLPAVALFALYNTPRNQPLFAEIDLGDIAQGGHKQQAFRYRNDSGAIIEVTAIETSCPCASIHLERNEVPVGQILAGNVSLELRPKAEFVGEVAIEAKGLTRRGEVAFVLMIRARVYSASQADGWTH